MSIARRLGQMMVYFESKDSTIRGAFSNVLKQLDNDLDDVVYEPGDGLKTAMQELEEAVNLYEEEQERVQDSAASAIEKENDEDDSFGIDDEEET